MDLFSYIVFFLLLYSVFVFVIFGLICTLLAYAFDSDYIAIFRNCINNFIQKGETARTLSLDCYSFFKELKSEYKIIFENKIK